MHSPCSSCGTAEGELAAMPVDVVVDSSSFLYLLQTNEPPSDSESRRLRDTLLQKAQKGMDMLDQKVVRLLAATRVAQEERDALQRFIDPYKSIVSPIRRLPPEVLMAVFLHLRKDRYKVFEPRKGPWVLGQICSRWRSIALACSELWSSMSLLTRFPDNGPSPSLRLAGRSQFQTALRRTGQRGLEIDFPYNWPFFDVLEPHTSQLKKIHLTISAAHLSTLAPLKKPLQSLTQLTIYVQVDRQRPSEQDNVVDAFEHSPHLRSILLSGFYRPQIAFKLPWTQLTDVSLQDVDMGVLEDVLCLIPGLQKLRIALAWGIDYTQVAPANGSIIVHPSLRSLSFHGTEILPSNISLPALEEVDIGPGSSSGPAVKCPFGSIPALTALLRRSNCSVKKLRLSDVEMDVNFFELLRSSPSITQLHVDYGNYDVNDDEDFGDLIRTLIYDPSDEKKRLLPKLEVLELLLDKQPDPWQKMAMPVVVYSMDTFFCSFIDSRTPTISLPKPQGDAATPSNLTGVAFDATNAIFPLLRHVDIEALKRHKANGLDVSVKAKRTTFHANHDSPELYDMAEFYRTNGPNYVIKSEETIYV